MSDAQTIIVTAEHGLGNYVSTLAWLGSFLLLAYAAIGIGRYLRRSKNFTKKEKQKSLGWIFIYIILATALFSLPFTQTPQTDAVPIGQSSLRND
ncbi:MAG TPA: hypothetical protein VHP34_11735 [Alphaproteobacteria bacterium]|nr:hypothetical protein [Alphaproteobacteria bacterium]